MFNFGWLNRETRSKTLFRIIVGALCILCGLILVLLLFHLSPAAPAPSRFKGKLALQVSLGFQGDYREGYWTPAQVTITNNGPDFTGTLALSVFSGPNSPTPTVSSVSPWSYETAVTLAARTKKTVTLALPFYFGNLVPQGFLATLRDSAGTTVASAPSTSSPGAVPYAVKPGNLLIGLLSDPNADFTALGNASIPNQTSSLTLVPLDAHTLPATSTVLDNFDVIVLDNFSSKTLNADQIAALRAWVNRGGVLVVIGGTSWQQTMSGLPADLLPITITGTTMLPAGSPLLPVSPPVTQTADQSPPPSDKLSSALPVSTARLRTQSAFSDPETILSTGANPLLLQARQGAGVVSYLAFDPASAPLVTWPAVSTLWRSVLFYAMGDRFLISNTVPGYSSGPGQILTRGGVLSLLEAEMPLGPWILAVLFLGYLLVLGPVRLLLMRRYKLPMWWSWRIFVGCVVVFSLLAYGLAWYQRVVGTTNTSVSLVQINQGGSSAHVTTYMGIYTPASGDVTLSLPGNSLAQTVAQPFLRNNLAVAGNVSATSYSETPTTMSSAPTQVALTMHTLRPWTFNPVVTEQDRSLHGSLTTNLKLLNNRLVGTVTNTLATSLSDAYVLLPHSAVALGKIPAGATQQVNLPLPAPSNRLLEDQIAAKSALPAAYFPYLNGQRPQTDLQRRSAFLSAVSGAGFVYFLCSGPCQSHAVMSRGTIYPTGGQSPNPAYRNGYDPLLIAGAPATLIAWADQPMQGIDDATLNGVQPAGRRMDFLQLPIDLGLAGSLQSPPDFISGHAVDMNYDAQETLPGIYSLSTGNVTFSIALPAASLPQANSVTLTVPDLLASPTGLSSVVQVQLYNWHTSSWEGIQLHQNTFTTTNLAAYAGPNGHLLVQVGANHQHSPSTLYFSRPFVTLQGNASPSASANQALTT